MSATFAPLPSAADPAFRPPLLTLEGVGKTFGTGTVALKGLSLELRRGDFLAVLGPSGCGKSTLLRLIAGLAPPSAGRIAWHDPEAQANLGVVFQEPTLMPWATVERNVWLPLRLQGLSRAEARPAIEEALALVGLEPAARSYPRELSGGMKMRVAIARALVTRPRLILMDEPFGALDEIARFRLNDDLLALRQALGCTIVFVTHSVFESVYLAERIAVMTPRPGRVHTELAVPEPYPRASGFRTSADYAAHTRRASAALVAAMSGGTDAG